ncbi:MAG: T9SS type A sorting domain-containing protein, partial [Bacteroidales bacterium]
GSYIIDNNTADLVEYYPASNTWTVKSTFPGGERIYAHVFVINDIAFIVSGAYYTPGVGYACYQDVWKYTPTNNSWSQLNNFPGTPRHGGFAFAHNGKGYLGLGYGNLDDPFIDVWEYNPATDSWTQKSNFPGTPFKSGFQFSIDKCAFIGMGYSTGLTQLDDVWQYDADQDIWTQKNDFTSYAMSWVSNFTMNGKGYVVCGKKLDLGLETNEFWEYNPQTDSWIGMPAFSGAARLAASGFAINGKGYTGLGAYGSSTYMADFWEFTPSGYGVDQTNVKQKAEVNIYPNPSNAEVNVEINNPEHKDLTLSVFDADGKCVKQFKAGNNSQLITAEHSVFSAGTYFIAVSFGENTIVKKLVIE